MKSRSFMEKRMVEAALACGYRLTAVVAMVCTPGGQACHGNVPARATFGPGVSFPPVAADDLEGNRETLLFMIPKDL